MAKKVFMKKKEVIYRKMNLELNKIILKCIVQSVALYAAKTWPLTQTARRRSEASEMWIWKRMEKIILKSYYNEEVLR